MSRLLRLRVPQDMTLIDRIHLAELVILDVHNIIGTTSASRSQAKKESNRDLSFNYHVYPNPIINGAIGGSYFQSIGYVAQLPIWVLNDNPLNNLTLNALIHENFQPNRRFGKFEVIASDDVLLTSVLQHGRISWNTRRANLDEIKVEI
jgi:hypothetical protein